MVVTFDKVSKQVRSIVVKVFCLSTAREGSTGKHDICSFGGQPNTQRFACDTIKHIMALFMPNAQRLALRASTCSSLPAADES
jgi:hypothetical protein